MANKTDALGWAVVQLEFWIPEKEGDQITGVVTGFETRETQHGDADYALVADLETGEEQLVVIGGGLMQLPKQLHKLVRITYEGEKENPNAKKGRNKIFKSYQLEVATKFDYAQWAFSQQ